MKKIVILIVVLLAVCNGVSAQGYKNRMDSLWIAHQIKRGERLFDNMRYLKTSDIYGSIFEKGVLNDKGKSILSRSYLYVASYKNALEVLRSMDSVVMQPSDVYNMAQCLKFNEVYDESDKWMRRFEQMKSDDTRSTWQRNSASEITKIIGTERYKIVNVPFNSSQSDFGAFVQGDGVIFASARKVDELLTRQYGWNETPYLNIFEVSVKDESYSQPKIYSSKLKTIYHDGPVAFNADGTEIYVTQNPNKSSVKGKNKIIKQFQLLVAKKQIDGTWGKLAKLPFNGDGFSTGHAVLSPDGQTLWFASDRPGGMGRSDIYFVKRQGDSWSDPVNAGHDINTEGDEMFPFEASDGKLYFSSNGHLTLGGLDVCVAFKTASGYAVRNMGNPINGPSDDFALFMLSDNGSGFFASNRSGGVGDDDIYHFDVIDPVVLNRQLEIRLLDKVTLKPIENVELTFSSASQKQFLKTDASGMAVIMVDVDDEVTVSSNAPGYKPNSLVVPISSAINTGELRLEPIPVWGVYGTVTDLATGLGVDSVQVFIQPVGQRGSIGNMTLDGGSFRNEIQPETDYVLIFNKPGYFTKRGNFTTKGRVPGWINVDEFMGSTVEKIEVNKVIEIPNIYYDLGKWTIRKDAAVELDKVIAFMTDNPSIVIELGSHTDSRGSAVSNQALSQKRAQSAVDYIVKKGGIAANHIFAKGYGESQLKNHCADGVACSEQEHQQNRRTEIRVVGVK
ncbi:MAG: OmpA family protein [Breznakibacter sp.]